jgi:hypothetical protein
MVLNIELRGIQKLCSIKDFKLQSHMDKNLPFTMDSMNKVKTACERELSLFMEVAATRLFSQPLLNAC